MVNIDTGSDLEGFRRFLISSTCLSLIPESYLADTEVFPEKEGITEMLMAQKQPTSKHMAAPSCPAGSRRAS